MIIKLEKGRTGRGFTKDIGRVAAAQHASLDVGVEGLVVAETGRVGECACGVVEVFYEAGCLVMRMDC
jgi:hypothetical protein